MPVVIQCFIVCVCKISHETNNPLLNHGYLYLEIFSRMIALTCACFSLQHVCFFFMASFLSTINQLHTHQFNGPFSGTIRVSRYLKGKPIWILLEQETVSGNGISWTICIQITTPAPHHSVFYRLDAFPAAQPTASKH